MATRLVSLRSLLGSTRSFATPINGSKAVTCLAARGYSTDGPNGEDVLPHVNEEAQKSPVGGGQPDVDGQGTPISEVINRDPAAKEKAPEVLQDNFHFDEEEAPSKPVVEVTTNGGRRMYRSDTLAETHGYPRIFFPVSTRVEPNPDDIYGLPKLPLPGTYRMTDRYVPIVDQVTNMIMEHGMKAKAQANMSKILGYLRTKPMPKPSAKYSMISGSPPLSTLPSNPIAYLQTAIDSLAPLVKLKSVRGSGGFSNTVPVPLNLRQRRRTAIVWILDAVAKRVPGPIRFPEKFAEEIISVVEGRSKAWEKRNQAHKTAVASRANVKA